MDSRRRFTLVASCAAVLCLGCGREPHSPPVPEPPEGTSFDTISEPRPAPAPRRVVILGDSLTAGHTLPREDAWPARIQDFVTERRWPFTIVNAGVNGDTSTDGLARIDWVLREPAEVLVIELGGNDGLRGIPVEVTRSNLQAMIDRTRALHPDIRLVLAGMKLPPNYGPEYVAAFEAIYPALAERNNIPLIPFLLEGVATVAELNFEDGIHPTAEGHRIVANVVWNILSPILADLAEALPSEAS